jgi:hypothetical protein
MKFENKKWVLRVALAGALSLGMATVAKADDSTDAAATAVATAAATPAAVSSVSAPVFSVLAQELGTQSFGSYSGIGAKNTSNAVNGDSLAFTLQHVQVGGSFGIDALDNVTVKTDLAGNGNGGFTLLGAYDVHNLNDIYGGLAVKVGQFNIPFGADQYASPDQLIRIGYSSIDALVPGGAVVNGNAVNLGGNNPTTVGSVWDMGVELDQTYKDLTIQIAAVQNGGTVGTVPVTLGVLNPTGNKDYVGRVQWKSSNVSLGVSDYYQSTSILISNNPTPVITNNINTFGANASINVDIYQLDLEAIWGSNSYDGYTGTLSAKPIAGFQPAVWYEFLTPAGTAPANTASMLYPDLGAGLNFNLGAKTRLALNVDFTGYSASTTTFPNSSIFDVNTETVQLQEVF